MLRRLGQAVVFAAPLLATVLALGFSLGFLMEAAERIGLWIFVYHFAPYANHADGVADTLNAGKFAAIIAPVPALLSLASPKQIRATAFVFGAVVLLMFCVFWLVVATKGLVTYEEFAAHGV